MKIIRLQSENFKRLQAVDISPDGGLVTVRGNNAEGKTSVLDSIFAALGGAAGAPIKPVRTGEEYAIIRLDLGDLKVTRYFDEQGDKLKVENAEGATFGSPQTMLDKLVGAISFDPLAFARMDAKAQAAELRKLVPLSVNLDELAAADRADIAARRDINRDEKAKRAQAAGVEVSGIVPERPDRAGIIAKLTGAAEANGQIERDRLAREREQQEIGDMADAASAKRLRAQKLREEANALCDEAEAISIDAVKRQEAFDALPDLPAPVDTAKLSDDLAEADKALALLARIDQRKALEAEADQLKAQSDSYTKRLEDRAKLRADALAAAEMPVNGLSFAEFNGDQIVTFEGEPFSQASGAQQLRVSMALAMAANPKLRVMLIKDGSLLDANGMAIVKDMAEKSDMQVWLEAVGVGDGVGIIIEDGKVVGAPVPEPLEAPKRRKKTRGEQGADDEGKDMHDEPINAPIVEAQAPTRRRRPPSLSELNSGNGD